MIFTFAPSPELFATLHPFHLVFDRQLNIRQVGSLLQQIDPIGIDNQNIHQYLRIKTPKAARNFDEIITFSNTIFSVALRNNGMILKGKMSYVATDDMILFMADPVIRDISYQIRFGNPNYIDDVDSLLAECQKDRCSLNLPVLT